MGIFSELLPIFLCKKGAQTNAHVGRQEARFQLIADSLHAHQNQRFLNDWENLKNDPTTSFLRCIGPPEHAAFGEIEISKIGLQIESQYCFQNWVYMVRIGDFGKTEKIMTFSDFSPKLNTNQSTFFDKIWGVLNLKTASFRSPNVKIVLYSRPQRGHVI